MIDDTIFELEVDVYLSTPTRSFVSDIFKWRELNDADTRLIGGLLRLGIKSTSLLKIVHSTKMTPPLTFAWFICICAWIIYNPFIQTALLLNPRGKRFWYAFRGWAGISRHSSMQTLGQFNFHSLIQTIQIYPRSKSAFRSKPILLLEAIEIDWSLSAEGR